MTAEHSAQHSAGDGEVGCAEKYPCDANRAVSRKTGRGTREWTTCPGPVFEENPNHTLDDQIRAVQQTPHDKRPGRAVPETAEEHDDHEIQRHPKRRDLIATERN